MAYLMLQNILIQHSEFLDEGWDFSSYRHVSFLRYFVKWVILTVNIRSYFKSEIIIFFFSRVMDKVVDHTLEIYCVGINRMLQNK